MQQLDNAAMQQCDNVTMRCKLRDARLGKQVNDAFHDGILNNPFLEHQQLWLAAATAVASGLRFVVVAEWIEKEVRLGEKMRQCAQVLRATNNFKSA
jgi:hypothetical protein